MLISHKHKFITIDIPKTGTRSLRETIEKVCPIDLYGIETEKHLFYQHNTALECKQALKTIDLNFSEYFSFTIVRNPWERYLSFFKYYREKAEEYLKTTDFKEWTDPEILQGKFASNLFNKNEQHILKTLIINQPEQSHYFLNDNQDIVVSHVARFENLQNEFDYFCETVGVDKIKLLHSNKSETKISCSDIYNQELIDLVEEKERYLINFKKYEFK